MPGLLFETESHPVVEVDLIQATLEFSGNPPSSGIAGVSCYAWL